MQQTNEACDLWDTLATTSNHDVYGNIDETPVKINNDPLLISTYFYNLAGYMKLEDTSFKMIDCVKSGHFDNIYNIADDISNELDAVSNVGIDDSEYDIFDKVAHHNDKTYTKFDPSSVSQEHHYAADEIRDYYSGKLTMIKMLDETFTPYQTELSEYLSRKDHGLIKHREIGMLSSLPKAFMIDTAIDQSIKESVVWANLSEVELHQQMTKYLNAPVQVEFIRATTSLGKFAYSYHFREITTGMLIELMVPKNYTTRFMELYFRKHTSITLHLLATKVFTSNGQSWVRAYNVDIH